MKKSLLNTAISSTLSAALLSASVLSTQVYANEVASTNNNNSTENTTETYMLPGMGAGAAAGAVVAGPAGLLIGGIIGAFVGSNQEVATDAHETVIADDTSAQDTALIQEPGNTTKSIIDQADNVFSDNSVNQIHLAQLGGRTPVVEKNTKPVQDELVNILTTDLSLDIYFRSGSTTIESFYPDRLAAIAKLMKTMDSLELHLDGYTDRRGNKSQNNVLANQRIDKVRQQLVLAGVEEHRIISKAFGEMKMVSEPGDLAGYTFDRKVVIRFERTDPDSIQSMKTALSDTSDGTSEFLRNNTSSNTSNETNIDPVVADAATRF
jgi:sortase system peptidoglycan-associated protein